MATLYELNEMYRNIQFLIESGEYTEEELKFAIDSVNGEISEKLEGYAMVVKNLESDIAGLKAEEKRLADRRKSLENGVERMKEAMQDTLLLTGEKRVKTSKFTISLRKSTSVEVENEDLIPEEFVKITKTISKSELAKRLKETEVPGAKLVEKESLQIL
ncbi:siphovirus Gp157 family protein [Ureibacillus suwonensis]|uniref:Siphovirus Gp157 family protein n=1 Tax=Ureibacillus suwonensis TaxID=313007 RepID=A0ABW0RDY1_9BACL